MIVRKLNLLFNALHQERKKEEEKSHKACMGTFGYGRSPIIYKYWVREIFTKPS